MRLMCVAVIALAYAGLIAQESVVSLDVPGVVAAGTQDTSLGQFELLAWSNKDAFPVLAGVEPYRDGRPKGTYGRMSLGQVEQGLLFHNEGRSKKDPMYDRAGLVAFTPKQPGRYALNGTIRCHSGAKRQEDGDTVTWAVVVFSNDSKEFRVVKQETRGRKDRVFELRNYPELQTIDCAAGERIGLTIWRHKWQWYGGGRVEGLQVAPADQRSWETGHPPADDELSGPTGLPFKRDFTAGDELEVRMGLPGFSPSAVGYAEHDGRRHLDLAIRGVNWCTMSLTDCALRAGAYYRMRVSGRCLDQVEIIEGTLPGVGQFSWQPNPQTEQWEIQFAPAKDMILSEVKWRFRGSGHWLLAALELEQIDGFTVPVGGERSRGELLVGSDFGLGKTGWSQGWNHISVQRNPAAFGTYDYDEHGSFWSVPAGGVGGDGGTEKVSVTAFNTTPLHLNYGASYTAYVEASAPVTLRLRGHKDVVQTWRFTPESDPKAVFERTPPRHGVFAPNSHATLFLEVEAEAPNVLRRVSFSEGPSPAAAPAETGVQLSAVRNRYNHRVTTDQVIPVRLFSPALAAGSAATLVVSDHRDRAVRQQDVVTTGSTTDLVIESLPPGWYQLRLVAGDARAVRSPVLVVPKGDLAARNQHLGSRHNGAFGQVEVAGKTRWRNWYAPAKVDASCAIGLSKAKIFNGWSESEPSPGDWTFGFADNLEILLEQGVEVTMVLGSAPTWARRKDGDTPRDLAQWESAVRTMAEHWRGRVQHYVVWNEPDLARVPVALHVELCAIAYRVLKEVDPNNVVIVGCTTTSGRTYLEESIAAGLLQYGDVLGFHGYVREQSAHYGPDSFKNFVDPLLSLMQQRSEQRPIWDMEAAFNFGIDEGLAGAAMSSVYLKGLVTRQVAGIERYYSWGSAAIGWPGGGHFSMFFGQNYEPLITQALTASFVAMLGDARFVAVLGDDAAGVHCYHFRTAAGEDVLVGWRSTGNASEAFPQQVLPNVRALDEMARPIPGLTSVTLDTQLRYFTAEGSTLPAF
ncbi:MAG: hypothetical protein PF961_05415 [Planctomycetota bacterium]|jgi:hypothetical protein|nr:hypothetical protein [Planctomycetota bacterium]